MPHKVSDVVCVNILIYSVCHFVLYRLLLILSFLVIINWRFYPLALDGMLLLLLGYYLDYLYYNTAWIFLWLGWLKWIAEWKSLQHVLPQAKSFKRQCMIWEKNLQHCRIIVAFLLSCYFDRFKISGYSMSIKQCKVNLVLMSNVWRQNALQFLQLFNSMFSPNIFTNMAFLQDTSFWLKYIYEKVKGFYMLQVNYWEVKFYCKTKKH